MLLLIDTMSNAFKALNPSDTLSLKLKTANLEINTLQVKMDSLERIMIKTQIGSDFFSDAISSNLYNFSTIVFFAGLVLWGSLYGSLAVHKRQIKRDFGLTVQKLISDVDVKILKLEETLDEANHDVNRAMYSKVTVDKDWPNSFDWAISCTKTFAKCEPNDYKGIVTWLSIAEESLKLIEVGDSRLIDITTKITEYLTPLTLAEDQGIKDTSIGIL